MVYVRNHRLKVCVPPVKKKSGGQLGHKGQSLPISENPDHIEEHSPEKCSECCKSLEQTSASDYRRRQVIDVPLPKAEVTEHRAIVKECPSCGHKNQGLFPEEVKSPVSYGRHVQALAVYLLNVQLIPEDRLEMLFKDIFCLPIRAPTLVSFGKKLAARLAPWQEGVSKFLHETTKVAKHLDESGLRVEGRTSWLHTISTEVATLYRVSIKRGAVPTAMEGVVVHDHFKPYFKQLNGTTHALCNAHHLRELKALIEEDEAWAKKMYWLLLILSKLEKEESSSKTKKRFVAVYDKIIAKGFAFHESLPIFGKPVKRGRVAKRPGHNLLIRLKDYKEETLRCLYDHRVPFSNNLAEQDIRMIKVKQKISGCFRSMEGAQDFALIRSFLSTNRKRGINLLVAIQRALREHAVTLDGYSFASVK